MELTQEHFDEQIKKLATKKDIEEQTEALARIISDTIATPMHERFDELKDYLEVREDVATLKVDMVKIKEALHIQ
jgi:hypothetical protein